MNDPSPPDRSARPILGIAVLVPEQDLPAEAVRRSARASAGDGAIGGDPRSIFADPYQALVGHPPAWIDLRFSPRDPQTRVDLPYDDPRALSEVLETLYLLDGWPSVELVVGGAQRALAWTLLEIYPVAPLRRVQPVSAEATVHHRPTPADPIAAARALVAAVAKGWPMPAVLAAAKLMQTTPRLFAHDLPEVSIRSPTPSFVPDPHWLARAQANVVLALEHARNQLADRVRRAAWRVEREASRQLTTALADAYAVLMRETHRYFPIQGQQGAAALLASNVQGLRMRTVEPTTGGPAVLDAGPAALRAALQEVKPFAETVRKMERTPEGTPSPAAMVREARARSRAVLAREIGRHTDAFPVLPRLSVDEVIECADADAEVLGQRVLPVLKQCYGANLRLQGRMARLVGLAEVGRADPRPERALADKVAAAGSGHSVWTFWKYVERAGERIVGVHDTFTSRVIAEVAASLATTDAGSTAAWDQLRRETLLLAAAEGAQRGLVLATNAAMERAMQRAMGEALVLGFAKRASRSLVPVLNLAMGAMHIASSISEFGERKDEFYCTLDPRDALADAPPSFAGLAADVAIEAFFALI